MEAGVDSLAATELSNRLAAQTQVKLSPTLVFDAPTPRAIGARLLATSGHLSAAKLSCSLRVREWFVNPASCLARQSAFGQRHRRCSASIGDIQQRRRFHRSCAALQARGAVGYPWSLRDAGRVPQFGGFIARADMANRAFGVSMLKPQQWIRQRILLELGYEALHARHIVALLCWRGMSEVCWHRATGLGHYRANLPIEQQASVYAVSATTSQLPPGACPSCSDFKAPARAWILPARRRCRVCTWHP